MYKVELTVPIDEVEPCINVAVIFSSTYLHRI